MNRSRLNCKTKRVRTVQKTCERSTRSQLATQYRNSTKCQKTRTARKCRLAVSHVSYFCKVQTCINSCIMSSAAAHFGTAIPAHISSSLQLKKRLSSVVQDSPIDSVTADTIEAEGSHTPTALSVRRRFAKMFFLLGSKVPTPILFLLCLFFLSPRGE